MSGEKNTSWRPESFRGLKDGRGKIPHQEALRQNRRMRSSACRWRTNYCGIFCGPQERSKGKGKILCHISTQNRVSRGNHAQILCSIQKRLLYLCPPSGQAGEGRRPCRSYRTAAGTQLLCLWLPVDVAMAEKPEYFLQPQNCAASHEEIWFAV